MSNQLVTYKGKTPPATLRQFKSRIEGLARKSNLEATDMTIEWTFGPQAVTWPTGLKGFSGGLLVKATGYRSQRMIATYTEGGGLHVR